MSFYHWVWFLVEDSNKYTFKIYSDGKEAIDDFEKDIIKNFGQLYNISKYTEVGKFYRQNYLSIVEWTNEFHLEVNDELIEDIQNKTKDSNYDTIVKWIESNIITSESSSIPVKIISIDNVKFDVKNWNKWEALWVNNQLIGHLDSKSNGLDNLLSKGSLNFACKVGKRRDSIPILIESLGDFGKYVSNDIKLIESFDVVVRIRKSNIKARGIFKIDKEYANICPITGVYEYFIHPIPKGKKPNVFSGIFEFTISFDDIVKS